MKLVPMGDSTGMVLAHDMTEIIPGNLIFPRLLAGEKVVKEDIVRLGHGGLCMGCKDCRYPNCGFGKVGLYKICIANN